MHPANPHAVKWQHSRVPARQPPLAPAPALGPSPHWNPLNHNRGPHPASARRARPTTRSGIHDSSAPRKPNSTSRNFVPRRAADSIIPHPRTTQPSLQKQHILRGRLEIAAQHGRRRAPSAPKVHPEAHGAQEVRRQDARRRRVRMASQGGHSLRERAGPG